MWIIPEGVDPTAFGSFIYVITSPSGRRYCGCKVVRFRRGKKWIESDWRDYFGSNEELLDEIAQSDKALYKREIIHLIENRKQTLYWEQFYLFQFHCLHEMMPDGVTRAWYNNKVGNWYAPRSAFHVVKKVYAAKPLKCSCGKAISFKRRHSGHCSARCEKAKDK